MYKQDTSFVERALGQAINAVLILLPKILASRVWLWRVPLRCFFCFLSGKIFLVTAWLSNHQKMSDRKTWDGFQPEEMTWGLEAHCPNRRRQRLRQDASQTKPKKTWQYYIHDYTCTCMWRNKNACDAVKNIYIYIYRLFATQSVTYLYATVTCNQI